MEERAAIAERLLVDAQRQHVFAKQRLRKRAGRLPAQKHGVLRGASEQLEGIVSPIAERAKRIENAQRFARVRVRNGLNLPGNAARVRKARENRAPLIGGAAEHAD